MEGRGEVLILSSNNYLGLSAQPEVVAAGKAALDRCGAGTASVRFICGTFTIHRALEAACARLVGTPASLSFVSCWNANEAVPGHAAGRGRHRHQRSAQPRIDHRRRPARQGDHQVPDGGLQARRPRRPGAEADGGARPAGADGRSPTASSRWKARSRRCPTCCEVCRKHDAVLVVDDSHATGVLGATGRGTAEHFGMVGEVDIITSTLGKALGRRGRRLRRRVGRRLRLPHPALATAALLQRASADRGGQLARGDRVPRGPPRAGDPSSRDQARYFRERLLELGFKPLPGETPIIPVILGETAAAIRMSDLLLAEGVFVTGFGYPVVPQGQARVRCQISAAHTRDDLDQALAAFAKVGRQLGLDLGGPMALPRRIVSRANRGSCWRARARSRDPRSPG